jgi:hypothetical protein
MEKTTKPIYLWKSMRESMISFIYEHIKTQEEVRKHIQECEGRHTQQAIYSTFHDALTQVCFGCKKIRSTIFRAEKNEKSNPAAI